MGVRQTATARSRLEVRGRDRRAAAVWSCWGASWRVRRAAAGCRCGGARTRGGRAWVVSSLAPRARASPSAQRSPRGRPPPTSCSRPERSGCVRASSAGEREWGCRQGAVGGRVAAAGRRPAVDAADVVARARRRHIYIYIYIGARGIRRGPRTNEGRVPPDRCVGRAGAASEGVREGVDERRGSTSIALAGERSIESGPRPGAKHADETRADGRRPWTVA